MTKYLIFFKKYFTKREIRLFLLLAICIVLCALYFLLAPRVDKLNSLKNQLNAVNNERSSYEKLYKNYLDYDKILAEYKDLIIKVPVNNDISKFIIDMEEWTECSGISLISIIPQKTKTEQIEETDINIIPCEVTICGEFDLLLSFISELETYSRICRINDLQLTALSENISYSTFEWKLTVNVSLYYIPLIT